MSNKIAVWGLVLIAVVMAVGYYFYFVQKQTINDPIQVVPNNAVVVMQLDNPHNFYKKISNDNEIWQSFKKGKNTAELLDQIELLDSIVSSDRALSSINTGQFIVSIHFDTTFNETQILFTIEISGEPGDIIEDLKQHFVVSYSELYKQVYSVTTKESGLNLFAGFSNNILLISKQDWFIDRILQPNKSKTRHFSKSEAFVKLRNTAGKNTDARIYFNHKCFSKMLANSFTNSAKNTIDGLGNFAEWTEVDLMVKKEELLFSGFTTASKNDYLSRFSLQEAENISMFKVAPYNTCLLYALNFSDIAKIVDEEKLSGLSKSLNFEVPKLLETCANEFGAASNASSKNQIDKSSWFFLKSKDVNKTKNYLDLISSNTGIKSGIKAGKRTIREIKYKNLIPELFGNSYSIFQTPWYTFIDDFVVFANSAASLKQLINYYEAGKTLDLSESFNRFKDNFSASSNVFMYVSPRHITAVLSSFLESKARSIINNNESVTNDFSGLSFQFSSRDSIFYTNFYLRNDKTAIKENLDHWRIELDYEVSGKPYLVKDHSNNTYNIVAFDKESNIYLISADGQIKWKKKLDNIPESGINQIDYYKNGKVQYLFSTRDFIYLLDKNGEKVGNYPKKINPSATNGIGVFDYDKNKTYRMLLAQADKRVYNYTESGKKVEGWLKPVSENIVTEPIVHLSANGLDYILITDISNNLNIVNRRGEQRIKLSKRPDKARNSTYYINKTNSKGIILTTDKYGRLTYISNSGKIQYTEFGEYSADHFFLYEDFTGNGAQDFIYIEGNQINVFDRLKRVLFNYKFPSDITIKPVFFKLGRKQNVLGIVDQENKTIYLFDKEGNPIISSGLVGENPFTVGSLNNDGELSLITSVGKTLYNYRLK